MAKKVSLQLAEEVYTNDVDISGKQAKKSPKDESYSSVILGVNQDFTEDVTEEKQAELIKKYSIKEVPDKDNYYTFKINGNYYVKSSNTHFNLYENVKIRIPNGNWDGMYIEVQKDTVNEATTSAEWYIAVDEPTEEDNELKGGDYWIKIEDDTTKNMVGIYQWDKENKEWVENCLVSSNAQLHTSVDEPSISNVKKGDYWAKIDDDLRRNIIEIRQCTEDNNGDLIWDKLVLYSGFCQTAYENRTSIVIGGYDNNTIAHCIKTDTKQSNNIVVGKGNFLYGDRVSIVTPECNGSEWIIDVSDKNLTNGEEYYIVAGSKINVNNDILHGWFPPDLTGNYGSFDFENGTYLIHKITYNGESTLSIPCTRNYDSREFCYICMGNHSHCGSNLMMGSNNFVLSSGNIMLLGDYHNVHSGNTSIVAGNDLSGYNDCGSYVGMNNCAQAGCSLVGGRSNFANCVNAVVAGECNWAQGTNVIVVGEGLFTTNDSSACFGRFNSSADSRLTVGNGRSAESRSNAFTISQDGTVGASASYSTTAADYAEYYEWQDGNPNNEDRTGLFVTVDGRNLNLASFNDTYILGVVSATPSIVGNAHTEDWKGRFKKDIFERYILDKDGYRVISEEYDPTQKYISYKDRPEKSAVGTHGQLIVIDDGTCEVNGYCGVGVNGVGTKCDDMEKVYRGLAFRVTERLDDTHIRIIIK